MCHGWHPFTTARLEPHSTFTRTPGTARIWTNPKDPFPVTKNCCLLFISTGLTLWFSITTLESSTAMKKLQKFQPLSHNPKLSCLNNLTPCHELRAIFKQQEEMYGHTNIRLEGV